MWQLLRRCLHGFGANCCLDAGDIALRLFVFVYHLTNRDREGYYDKIFEYNSLPISASV